MPLPQSRYSQIMNRPTPAGVAPGTNFDWWDAAPMQQTPQGLVQQSSPMGRQRGIVPGTLYGGLVDTRYSQGLESLMSPQAPVRPIDTDLATGQTQYNRQGQFDELSQAIEALKSRGSRLATRKDGAARKAMAADQPALDELTAALTAFQANQNPGVVPDLTKALKQSRVAKNANAKFG